MTLGELMAMAKGRQKAEWERAALLAAITRNSYPLGGKRKRPFQPWEFNPFEHGPPPAVDKPKIKIKVECLKGLCNQRAAGSRQ
jgi:hypothetical protein